MKKMSGERNFTKNKDADRLILQNLDDEDLFRSLLTNKYTNSLVDENFWMNRVLSHFSQISKYKEKDMTWRKFYVSIVYYTNKMETKFGFKFTQGNPRKYYEALKANKSQVGRGGQAMFLWNGMEDAALFYSNKLNSAYDRPLYTIGSPEWEEEKKNLLETFPRKRLLEAFPRKIIFGDNS